ncbi:MAG: 4Fe-4S binding protein [Candidatus Lokiarchaeota archaeon]|nr:4Fe-4S binding protein [Candidatus Lokiarchaeota archaeon]
MIESDIYDMLSSHLDNMPIGYPKTESGVELKLLKMLFTPKEALIACALSFFPEPLIEIHQRIKDNLDISLEELEAALSEMDIKGTITFIEVDGVKLYRNLPFAIGMYEYQLGRLTPEFSREAFTYLKEAFIEKEYNLTGIPQLRTIPVETAITPDLGISSYDNVRDIIKNSEGFIGIMDCICRLARDLLDDSCKTTDMRKTCMTFGVGAEKFHEKGLAEYISKEEALILVEKMEREGLVPQPSNSQNPFVICNCCGCCCEVLSNQKTLVDPAKHFASNYVVKINLEECNACGYCVDSCPMEALHVNHDKCSVSEIRCIGCGLCVSKCPTDALRLKKKQIEIVPPKTSGDTYKAIMEKKLALTKK